MSSAGLGLHYGFVWECKLAEEAPDEWKKQIIWMFSTKVALAAWIDYQHADASGSIGAKFLAEIEERFEKVSGPQKA